jgi:catechol 2,3-dioxygenase-like lactoylglutathione lyase family enzyme
VLQHVSLEVPQPDAEASLAFWELLGFRRVAAPEEIAEYVFWVEREGTQIHLILTDPAYATVPKLGHAAVVVDDLDRALAQLEAAGHEAAESRRLWGARRAFAVAPGGHRVELMASPPPASG